jgi:hypothetical protein
MSRSSNSIGGAPASTDTQALNLHEDAAMSTLRFPIAGVRKLMDHALASPSHMRFFGYPGRPRPSLALVKDDGIYLMSNGNPRLMASKRRNFIVCADRFDPTKRDRTSVWDDARAAVGGDDFAEQIALNNQLIEALREGDCTALIVSFTKKTMSIETEHASDPVTL